MSSSSSLISCRLVGENCLSAVLSRGGESQSTVIAVLRMMVGLIVFELVSTG